MEVEHLKEDGEKRKRKLTFLSVVLSTCAITGCIATIPLTLQYILRLKTLAHAELAICRIQSKVLIAEAIRLEDAVHYRPVRSLADEVFHVFDNKIHSTINSTTRTTTPTRTTPRKRTSTESKNPTKSSPSTSSSSFKKSISTSKSKATTSSIPEKSFFLHDAVDDDPLFSRDIFQSVFDRRADLLSPKSAETAAEEDIDDRLKFRNIASITERVAEQLKSPPQWLTDGKYATHKDAPAVGNEKNSRIFSPGNRLDRLEDGTGLRRRDRYPYPPTAEKPHDYNHHPYTIEHHKRSQQPVPHQGQYYITPYERALYLYPYKDLYNGNYFADKEEAVHPEESYGYGHPDPKPVPEYPGGYHGYEHTDEYEHHEHHFEHHVKPTYTHVNSYEVDPYGHEAVGKIPASVYGESPIHESFYGDTDPKPKAGHYGSSHSVEFSYGYEGPVAPEEIKEYVSAYGGPKIVTKKEDKDGYPPAAVPPHSVVDSYHDNDDADNTGMPCCCQQGPPGKPGYHGDPGKDGKKGEAGHKGHPGKDAKPGDHVHYIPKQCPCDSPKGIQGFAGGRGRPGEPGKPGTDGMDAMPGTPGEKGYKGSSGPNGHMGYKGPTGDRGVVKHGATTLGPDGSTGVSGKPGNQGYLGKTGLDGKDGHVGGKGRLGYDAKPGRDGSRGHNGKPGKQGYGGPPGSCGHCPAARLAPGY